MDLFSLSPFHAPVSKTWTTARTRRGVAVPTNSYSLVVSRLRKRSANGMKQGTYRKPAKNGVRHRCFCLLPPHHNGKSRKSMSSYAALGERQGDSDGTQ